jgi:hypothetical protein
MTLASEYATFVLLNRLSYIVLVACSSSYLLFMIRKYHHFEYLAHRFYIVSFAAAIIMSSGYHLYVDIIVYDDLLANDFSEVNYSHA